MKKIVAPLLIFFAFFFALTSFKVSKLETSTILHQMYDSIRNVKTLRISITAIERLGTTYASAASEVKLQMNPRRLYFNNKAKKLEILYNHNSNNNKALVKPNHIPNLNLDPNGNMMRKNQHYTIHELGFDFIGRSIALTLSKDKEGLKNFVYKGKSKKLNYNCYLLQYENPAYAYVEYTVGTKETASSIAAKLIVNDYLLRYKNDLLNDFGYLKKGKKILVPNLYCKKAVIFIDEKLMLPVSVSLYDDMGLFESYEYPSMTINPDFKEEDFGKDNKEYGFR
jgi:hypothetical protein